jgi:hypothetical protein
MLRTDLENGWWPASRSKKGGLSVRLGFMILLTAALALFVHASQAQIEGVEVTVEIAGTADPGASLTATADINIHDGSTLQSISWMQTGGAEASISPADANPTMVTLAAESILKDKPIFSLEEAGKVTIKALVETTSGVYEAEAEIHTLLPWTVKADIGDHAIDIPILTDVASENPEVTPDVNTYTLADTDLAEEKTVTLDDQAGSQAGAFAALVTAGQAQAEVTVAQVEGVEVTVEIAGMADPGATLTATANINIQDNSTIKSISWMQAGGAAASIGPADTNPTKVTLGAEGVFKEELIAVLAEPPIGPDQLPPNVPVPEDEFVGGLQNRFQVVAVNPFSLEEAGKVTIKAVVETTSGVYEGEAEIHVLLPWTVKADIGNHVIDVPIILHGKNQETYNWAFTTRPWNSSATLMDATSQNPEFTPDVKGQYTLAVTDLAENKMVTIDIYAGTWVGAITGQDADGRPLAANCTPCHTEGGRAPAVFDDWTQTGHAEIFTSNLNTSTHYSASCFPCHTVGFDPDANNYGFDDFGDYQGFLDSGLLNNPSDPADNLPWTTMLADFPKLAKEANIQCENCHGPQSSLAHNSRRLRSRTAVMGTDPRANISANVCGVCHGEPLRHARFQQWQLSHHANYELAVDEGESGSCARCHTGNGFLTWLPVLLGEVAGDPTASITVNWTADKIHPQTCATCHDPHNIGTTTGNNTNATVRISDETPLLIAGFKAPATPGARSVGRGAMCMTCHNTRRGLRNDNTWEETVAEDDTARAPHGGVQTDLLMGQNAYFVDLGANDPLGYPPGLPGSHANTTEAFPAERNLTDTCATCHMVKTPPPDLLAYNAGGTNHTFFASTTICNDCHEEGRLESVQGPVTEKLATLHDGITAAILAVIQQQIAAGNTIDLDGEATITDAADIAEIDFSEAHGRQAITVTFTDTTSVEEVRVSDVDVVNGDGIVVGQLYDFADDNLPKAGWNYLLVHTDKSLGVHNFYFARDVLDASIAAVGPLAGP